MDRHIVSSSLFKRIYIGLTSRKLSLFCLLILLSYIVIAVLTKMGWLAAHWNDVLGGSDEPPNWTHYFGTDILGRSVLYKVIHGVEVAVSVGFIVALAAVAWGVALGIVAGYFGGIVDEVVVWFYTVVSATPTLLLLMVVAFVMGKGISSICIALVAAGWTETCRLVRGEVMRQKVQEYVQAATAIGAGHFRKLFVHIIPNILPLIIYQFSLVFQTAIKREVILSYLGVGVQHKPSWGIMIQDAKTELLRHVWWEFFFATLAMFGLVFAVSILADSLRECLDPRLK